MEIGFVKSIGSFFQNFRTKADTDKKVEEKDKSSDQEFAKMIQEKEKDSIKTKEQRNSFGDKFELTAKPQAKDTKENEVKAKVTQEHTSRKHIPQEVKEKIKDPIQATNKEEPAARVARLRDERRAETQSLRDEAFKASEDQERSEVKSAKEKTIEEDRNRNNESVKKKEDEEA